MVSLEYKFTVPRRQAMLSIKELDTSLYELMEFPYSRNFKFREVARVPVFVWPMPTQDGCFIIEHQDGHCQKVQPYELTFLGSKELFDQYDWSNE